MGGYGGDFFRGLLDDGVGNIILESTNDRNKYTVKNYVYPNSIKNLHSLFRMFYNRNNSIIVDYNTRKIERQIENASKFLVSNDIKKLYDYCFDEDENIFFDNVFNYLARNLSLPFQYNFGSLHYFNSSSSFDIRRIYQNTGVIFLYTENTIYHERFLALWQIKDNFERLTYTSNVFVQNRLPRLLEYATCIDVGKLFFEDTLDDTISNTISDIVGTKINININKVKEYRIKNDEILKKYFGDDYSLFNDINFRMRRLELQVKVVNGEIN